MVIITIMIISGSEGNYLQGFCLRKGFESLLIIATSDKPEDALEDYAKRRQIGTMSACPETRGFGFKSTHPGEPGRIGRLPELS